MADDNIITADQRSVPRRWGSSLPSGVMGHAGLCGSKVAGGSRRKGQHKGE